MDSFSSNAVKCAELRRNVYNDSIVDFGMEQYLLDRRCLSDIAYYVGLHTNSLDDATKAAGELVRRLRVHPKHVEDFIVIAAFSSLYPCDDEFKNELEERVKKMTYYNVVSKVLEEL